MKDNPYGLKFTVFLVLSVIMWKDELLKGKGCSMNCQDMMTS